MKSLFFSKTGMWAISRVAKYLLFIILLLVGIQYAGQAGASILADLKDTLNFGNDKICEEGGINSGLCDELVKLCEESYLLNEDLSEDDRKRCASLGIATKTDISFASLGISNLEFNDLEKLEGLGSLTDISQNIDSNLNSLPNYVTDVVSKLKNLDLDNGMNAYDYLVQQSKSAGLNPSLPLLVLTRESRGNENAISPTGAAGLSQFTSGTAREFPNIFLKVTPCCSADEAKEWICNKNPNCNLANDDRFNPRKSIDAGIILLSRLTSKYDGNLILVLTAYNAGPGVANKCIDETSSNELISCVIQSSPSDAKGREVAGYIEEIATNYQKLVS